MEKITEFTPAFDRRKEGCGIHGVDLRMILKGDKGAVQFALYTNWHLPDVTEEFIYKPINHKYDIHSRFLPMPADLGYHSLTPIYKGQSICSESCEYLDGKPCYYDGSGLNAEIKFLGNPEGKMTSKKWMCGKCGIVYECDIPITTPGMCECGSMNFWKIGVN